ncbi:MAG: hypothetical protein ABF979_05675 [Gluconobacter sp.]|uniref:hypothetical protein n=1 Tax=Gluconobacter sp. TaxID=1876758 RepID=UPI0039EB6BE7
MSQNTEQNVRAAREQDGQVQEMHADMVKAVCGRRSDYPEDVFRAYLKRHIVQAEVRGAEEQRRKDAEGHGRPVYQWRLTPDDNWVTAVDSTELEQVRNGYPASETRTLFTRPANVAALEARVKVLETEVAEKGLAAVHLLAVLHRPDLTKTQKIEAAKRQLDAQFITGNIRAALTREGGV